MNNCKWLCTRVELVVCCLLGPIIAYFLLFSSLMSNPKFIELVVGVSASGNRIGDGGYGAILKYNDHLKELSYGYSDTLTVRLELRGVLEGILCLKEPCDVAIYISNQIVIDAWEKDWISGWKKKGWLAPEKTKIQHPDLYFNVDQALQMHAFQFFHVSESEHKGLYNQCKQLASMAKGRRVLEKDLPLTFGDGGSQLF